MEAQPDALLSIAPMLRAFSRRHTTDITLFDVDYHDVVNAWESLGLLDTRRVIFIVHGFRSSAHAEWVIDMKDSLLLQMDQTVVTVDWSGGADLKLWKYDVAAANSIVVGRWLSSYAKEIAFRRPEGYIWGIGHSFGAHLLGMAGKLSAAFSRITGLDPAGPIFERLSEDKRLAPTDASFMVDVIHTDGMDGLDDDDEESLPTKYFGTVVPLGTLDFYPNFGVSQPGASLIAGSHFRAYELFTWSILNPGKLRTNLLLNGRPGIRTHIRDTVPSLKAAEMGYYADASPPAGTDLQYFLATNEQAPWAPVSK